MPGSIARILKDAQYLEPLANSILAYKQKLEEAEGKKELIKAIDDFNNYYNKQYRGGQQVNQPTVNVPTVTGDTTVPNTEVPQSLPFDKYFKTDNSKGLGSLNNQAPTDNMPITAGIFHKLFSNNPIPPQQTNIQSQTDTQQQGYDPSKNPADYIDFKDKMKIKAADILEKYMFDPRIKPEHLKAALDIINMKMPNEPYVPKIEHQTSNDFLFSFDEKGRQIGAPQQTKIKDSNGWKYDRDASNNPIVYTTGGKQYLRESDGISEKIHFLPEGQKIIIDNKDMNELLRELNISKLRGDLTSLQGQYKILDNKHKKTKDEDEKATIQEQKDNLMTGINANVVDIISNIEQKLPNVAATIRDYLSDERFRDNPAIIDETISKELGSAGAPPMIIKLAKDLVNATIFGQPKK